MGKKVKIELEVSLEDDGWTVSAAGVVARMPPLSGESGQNLSWRLYIAGYQPIIKALEAALGPAPQIPYTKTLQPVKADPLAPTDPTKLQAFWNNRRQRDGKPDESRCGAELRRALIANGLIKEEDATPAPEEPPPAGARPRLNLGKMKAAPRPREG